MSLVVWLSFVLASVIMGCIPGPGVTTIIGYALSSGRRTALASVAGMAVGNALAMSVSLAGVGTVLAASPRAFTLLKWMGALYLVGLGIYSIKRSRPDNSPLTPTRPISPKTAFVSTIAIGTFHPKTIVFFVAFAPQFMKPGPDYALQSAILIVTFTLVVGCTDAVWAVAASRATQLLRGDTLALWSKRAGGAVLILAGLFTIAATH